MFFKTLIAAIVAALLAGGVVYYGMPEAEGEGSVALYEQEQSPRDRPLASLFDTYVKKPVKRMMEPKQTAPSPTVPSRTVSTQTSPSTPPPLPVKTSAQTPSLSNEETPRYYVLEKGELKEIEALPIARAPDALNPDASFKILSVSEQAKQIAQPDLRDRAYLDIVDFAVSQDLYTAAQSAMENIAQIELRDTARARIAVAYAQAGDTQSAFALIDSVEVDELRDILRLQVIEAVIRPEALPEPLQ